MLQCKFINSTAKVYKTPKKLSERAEDYYHAAEINYTQPKRKSIKEHMIL